MTEPKATVERGVVEVCDPQSNVKFAMSVRHIKMVGKGKRASKGGGVWAIAIDTASGEPATIYTDDESLAESIYEDIRNSMMEVQE